MRWKRSDSTVLAKSSQTHARPEPTRLDMHFIASDPVRCRQLLAGGYDAFASSCSSGSIRCRQQLPINADRLMPIGAAWFWAKAPASSLWKSGSPRTNRGAKILAEITGYGISTDNHHLTQPNPSGVGPHDAMEQALQSADLDEGELITSTPMERRRSSTTRLKPERSATCFRHDRRLAPPNR